MHTRGLIFLQFLLSSYPKETIHADRHAAADVPDFRKSGSAPQNRFSRLRAASTQELSPELRVLQSERINEAILLIHSLTRPCALRLFLSRVREAERAVLSDKVLQCLGKADALAPRGSSRGECQDTDTSRHSSPLPQPSRHPTKTIKRYLTSCIILSDH